jgi:hypothetical protein
MAEPLFINELIQQILNGNVRIPSFQRGFIWDADRVAHLMDSIYKGFPFGALLFWRTRHPLKTERHLGPFELPERDPDYPIDYILDGQQRATSIFGVFQSVLRARKGEDDSVFRIYFDLTQQSTIQDSNFIYVPDDEVDVERHFPLRLLFDPPEYRKFLRSMRDEIEETVDTLYQRFTTARIPIQTFSTDDRTAVAIVFERINRLGVELDTLRLLSAWTWSEDFDLQEEFQELAEDLAPFGFKDVGEDSDLLLRCCAAILKGDASPNTIVTLNGEEVRRRFQEVRKGINGAVDFLRANFKVYSAQVLPFPTIIIPLPVFFATASDQDTHPSENQHRALCSWVWRTFFSRRYSKRLEQLNTDISEIQLLKQNKSNKLGVFDVSLSEDFFTKTAFNLNTVNTKTFILVLANEGPLNFISGSPIALDPVLRGSNKKEFHHIFPRKFLTDSGISNARMNALTNFIMLSKADNNQLGGVSPSNYRKKMPSSDESLRLILKKALCPSDMFSDDFDLFEKERAALLFRKGRN